jgi:MASE1
MTDRSPQPFLSTTAPPFARLAAAASDRLRRTPPTIRLSLNVLMVGVVCALSTQIGFANKIPPHYISPLWPTNAILFAVLVVAPVRHWWAYVCAAYFMAVVNDARAGFPIFAILYLAADLVEVAMAAFGVRRFAGGVRSFDSLSGLLTYIVIAVVLAPFVSAFVAAFAGSTEGYWFYWRVWFLAESLAYLTLAPVILTWIRVAPAAPANASFGRFVEACVIAGGLLAISGPRLRLAGSRRRQRTCVGLSATSVPALGGGALRASGSQCGPADRRTAVDNGYRPGSRAFRHRRHG